VGDAVAHGSGSGYGDGGVELHGWEFSSPRADLGILPSTISLFPLLVYRTGMGLPQHPGLRA
jgi:hypothetical protein